MRNAARTDANQPSIIEALHKVGCQVYYLKQPVDLLVSGGPLGERNILLEVKMPGGSLNGEQQEFWMRWPGTKYVVHSISEALDAVCGKEMLK